MKEFRILCTVCLLNFSYLKMIKITKEGIGSLFCEVTRLVKMSVKFPLTKVYKCTVTCHQNIKKTTSVNIAR
jgi:hypothetical protein